MWPATTSAAAAAAAFLAVAAAVTAGLLYAYSVVQFEWRFATALLPDKLVSLPYLRSYA